MILEIRDFEFKLSVYERSPVDPPNIWCEIDLQFELPTTVSSIHFVSIWFEIDVIKTFGENLDILLDKDHSTKARLYDTAEEIVIEFSRTETEADIQININKDASSFVVSYATVLEIEQLNAISRQISDFIRKCS